MTDFIEQTDLCAIVLSYMDFPEVKSILTGLITSNPRLYYINPRKTHTLSALNANIKLHIFPSRVKFVWRDSDPTQEETLNVKEIQNDMVQESFKYQHMTKLELHEVKSYADVKIPSFKHLFKLKTEAYDEEVEHTMIYPQTISHLELIDGCLSEITLRNIQALDNLQHLELIGLRNLDLIYNVNSLSNVKHLALSFSNPLYVHIDQLSFPPLLESLDIAGTFAECKTKTQIHLPPTLTKLNIFYRNCTSPDLAISNFLYPASLSHFDLYLDIDDNELHEDRTTIDVCQITLPDVVTHLTFGNNFNQPLNHFKFPKCLSQFYTGYYFHQSLNHIEFPSTLHTLRFGDYYCAPLDHFKFPPNLKSLYLGYSMTKSLDHVTFSDKITYIYFGTNFNEPLTNTLLPDSLETMVFNSEYNQILYNFKVPKNLSTIVIRNSRYKTTQLQNFLNRKYPEQKIKVVQD